MYSLYSHILQKYIVRSKHYTLVNEVEFMSKYVTYMYRTGKSNGKLIIDLSCAILLFLFLHIFST